MRTNMLDWFLLSWAHLLFLVCWARAYYQHPRPVQFIESPKQVTNCDHCNSLILRCGITNQKTVAILPQPTIDWVLNDTISVTKLFPDAVIETFNHSGLILSQLTLTTPSPVHAGSYRCRATDGNDASYCNTLQCVSSLTLSTIAIVTINDSGIMVEGSPDSTVSPSTLYIASDQQNSTLLLPTTPTNALCYHNGVAMLGNNNALTGNPFELYGVYQCFQQLPGGVENELYLVRVLPEGWTNPPGDIVVTSVARARQDAGGQFAILVTWPVPLLTGGNEQLSYAVSVGNLITGTTVRIVSVNFAEDVLEFDFVESTITVGVVSKDGQEVSEVVTTAYTPYLRCSDALPPPALNVSCDDGLATVETANENVVWALGVCTDGNQTLHLSSESNTIGNLSVGTDCAFQAAAARRTYEDCGSWLECECYLPSKLEYSTPQHCNVSASVQFDHTHYNASEGSSVEICLSAEGHGFDIVLRTIPLTALGESDYQPSSVVSTMTAESSSQCMTVHLLQDSLIEEDEVFLVTMTATHPLVRVLTPSANITIIDATSPDYTLVVIGAFAGCGFLVIAMAMLLTVALLMMRRYYKRRCHHSIRLGIKMSEEFSAEFSDPVSVSPLHTPCPDEITLYDQFYPTDHTHLTLNHTHSSNNSVNSFDLYQHLVKIEDCYQQDSGIGEGKIASDFGSAFSGQSSSSYVHCGQYSCLCQHCQEGRSPGTKGKSPKILHMELDCSQSGDSHMTSSDSEITQAT